MSHSWLIGPEAKVLGGFHRNMGFCSCGEQWLFMLASLYIFEGEVVPHYSRKTAMVDGLVHSTAAKVY